MGDCYVYDDDDDDDDDDNVPVMDLFAGNFDNKPLDNDTDVDEPVQSIVDRVEEEANDVLQMDKEENGDVFPTEDSSHASPDDSSFDADFSCFGSTEPTK